MPSKQNRRWKARLPSTFHSLASRKPATVANSYISRALQLHPPKPMELESEEDGTALAISKGSTQFLGRTTPDRTVSRRHLYLEIVETGADTSLSFEVIGKNPALVIHGGDGGERKRIYRPLERGELRDGDRVSLSLRSPGFYRVMEVGRGVREAVRRREERTSKRKREEERRRKREEEMRLGGKGEAEVGEVNFGFEALDVSEFDPVKDFGFLVRGHELDKFPSQKMRPIRDWNWFLDDPRISSDEEEDLGEETNKRKKRKRVQKRSEDLDDEVWTGESEDKKVSIAEVEGGKKRKYSTRSHDQKKQDKDAESSGQSRKLKAVQEVEEDEDETLGGFIVNDDEGVEEEVDEEEEEEEFDEDEGY